MEFVVEPSIRDEHVACAIDYFWQAFATKLAVALLPETEAHQFLKRVINPKNALSAVNERGQLLGVAGFKTPDGAFIGGGMRDLIAVYGFLGSLWRAPVLQILERDCEDGVLLMDGIFVGADARGKGVGSALLDAIAGEARKRGLSSVRLDVIDSNPRARALYERHGFRAVQRQSLGPLRHLFGFESATQMRLDVR